MQSSGKSSVLESIVGRDFLPRGSGEAYFVFFSFSFLLGGEAYFVILLYVLVKEYRLEQ